MPLQLPRRAFALLALAAPFAIPTNARAAAPDPVDFLFRLGMLEGHLIIGHDLLRARHNALALPHFGHPVRELYDDIIDYLTAIKFRPILARAQWIVAPLLPEPAPRASVSQYRAIAADAARLAKP